MTTFKELQKLFTISNMVTVPIKKGTAGTSARLKVNGVDVTATYLADLKEGSAIALLTDKGNWYLTGDAVATQNTSTKRIIEYRRTEKKEEVKQIFNPLFLIYGRAIGDDNAWVGSPGSSGTRDLWLSNGKTIKKIYTFNAKSAFVTYISELPNYFVVSIKMAPTDFDSSNIPVAGGGITLIKLDKRINILNQYDYVFPFNGASLDSILAYQITAAPVIEWRSSQTIDIRDDAFVNNASGNYRFWITDLNYPPIEDNDLIRDYRYLQYFNLDYKKQEIVRITLRNINSRTYQLITFSSKFIQEENSYTILLSRQTKDSIKISPQTLGVLSNARYYYSISYRL